MSNCGRYELDKTIGWGRRATFFSARANGEAGNSLIVIRRARLAERSVAQQFLRAAAEQQAAVVAGCRRLAPILDFELDEVGFAYYATVHYDTSLGDIIDSGGTVDSAFLREIVTGILAALTELHEKSHRPHGNLTAGNVLFDPNGRVFLTDLAPSAKNLTVAEDLFALGSLIYQLIRRTTRIGTLNPPLEYSPEWTEFLGDEAEGWLGFTNHLLTRSRNAGPDALKNAAASLKSLASLAAKSPPPAAVPGTTADTGRKPPPKKSALPKVAALFIVLAIGGGGFIWWKKQQDEKKSRIARAEEEARRQTALGPAIVALREALTGPLPPEVADDSQLASLLGRVQKSLAGAGGKADVQAALGNWNVPDKLKARAVEWRSPPREWTRLADELNAATRLDLDGGRPIIEQLQDTVRAKRYAGELDVQWADTVAILSDLARARNPPVPDFTSWAASEVRSIPRLAEAPVRAASVNDKLQSLGAFVQKDWPRIQQARFEKGAPDLRQPPGEERLSDWPREWMREAQRYLRPTDEKLQAWQTIVMRAERRIGKRPLPEQPGWTRKLQVARGKIAEALESDRPEIDKLAAELSTIRDPIEEEHEKYAGLFTPWKERALAAAKKGDAQAALDEFKSMTKDLSPAYRTLAGVQGVIDALAKAIATPETITLEFSQAAKADWTFVRSDATSAIYKYKNEVEIPLIALGKDMAMAAVETPLILAKLSGSGASAPGDGPQIRTFEFESAGDWLWRGPRDFIQGNGIASYFAPGVSPGDTNKDSCPATWLSYAAASAMAEKLGGRLPTSEQWMKAFERPGPVRRLRSGAWTAQSALVATWRTIAPGHGGRVPDAGSFSKRPGLVPNPGYLNDVTAVSNDKRDMALWMKSVFPSGDRWLSQDNGKVFHHLIGNAAEWVTASNRPAIIGGSVVSPPPPGLPTNVPLTPPAPGAAAFDVTFRLAVPLAESGAGEGLKIFLQAAAGIQPPPAPIVD